MNGIIYNQLLKNTQKLIKQMDGMSFYFVMEIIKNANNPENKNIV